MKIAFTGIRGIPATYSGFETFAETSARALSLMGHTVFVYNRKHHYPNCNLKSYKGARLIWLPSFASKHLDTLSHTFLSLIHACFSNCEIIYICGVGNAILSFIPRIFGKKVFLNVDGLDWKREKWNFFASWFLKFSEKIALVFPNHTITDSKIVCAYYKETYGKVPVYIPYFTPLIKTSDKAILKDYNLEKDKYILCVGRLVPENNVHLLIDAYKKLKTNVKLVIVGDAPYTGKYVDALKKQASENIIFTGYLFKKPYRELSSNCLFFALPGHAGGMRVVNLEQMSFGNCILANNSKNNLEVLADTALFCDFADTENTAKTIDALLNDKATISRLRKSVKQRQRKEYRLKNVVKIYENFFKKNNLKGPA